MVVTRPRDQARPLIAALERAGARVVAAPTIRIAPPSSYKALDASLRGLASFDGVLFTSRNAVERFFKRAAALRVRLHAPRLVFAVGTETAAALRARGWKARAPKVHRGEALARALGEVKGLKLLIPRAKAAREVLPAMLRARGARITVAEAYRTVADPAGARALRAADKRGISAVTFTSGSTVEQFFKLFGPARSRKLFARAAAVSIGPVTSAALRALGVKPAAQARKATSEELARAVLGVLGEGGR